MYNQKISPQIDPLTFSHLRFIIENYKVKKNQVLIFAKYLKIYYSNWICADILGISLRTFYRLEEMAKRNSPLYKGLNALLGLLIDYNDYNEFITNTYAKGWIQ